jgi:hypothetical protein
MSYDLLLRRQSPGNYARGDEVPRPHSPSGVVLAAAAASTLLLVGILGAGRRVERTYYRATWRDLGRTQETPALTMRELVYGPGEDP